MGSEFGFERLLSTVAALHYSNGSESKAKERLHQMEERLVAQERDIAALQ
jgi:hypothetical protein